jgi:hypothetical protein
MNLTRVLSRQPTSDSHSGHKNTPWIASPLDHTPVTKRESRYNETSTGVAQSTTNNSGIQFQLSSDHDPDLPPFKHHHESSTVELFYDLFFVANLATFTANHEIVDADTLKNYIWVFTIPWFTWLETSLFDVRFATDSIFNRLCKAISFGVISVPNNSNQLKLPLDLS